MHSEYNKVFIPEDFERAVTLHVLKVFMFPREAPLILGIAGYSGCGKTFQCRVVLDRLGVKVFSLSGAMFENKEAGEPARLLRDTYNEAVKYCEENRHKYASLLIDDADVAFGIWKGDFQYTVNTQHILGELMNIADPDPNEEKRIPIILTGNDFSRIYGPVQRTGRMTLFPYEPNDEQIINMVFQIYNDLRYDETVKLVDKVNEIAIELGLPKPQISFYSHMKVEMIDDLLWKKYKINKSKIFQGSAIEKTICDRFENAMDCESLINLANQILHRIKQAQNNYLE